MFNKINQLFNFEQQALNLYAKRQEVIASNIANVDTPGYKAMDINFIDELKKNINNYKINNSKINLIKTSPNHFQNHHDYKNIYNIIPIKYKKNSLYKNKNTVDMNQERIKFIDNSLKYQASLIFINYQIKNIINVLKG